MISELFRDDQPLFVGFSDDCFLIGNARRDQLRGVITDYLPMRKRFVSRRLACWSMDGISGRHGQRCSLCRDRWHCTERIRLMMLLEDISPVPRPAVLEIGYASFDALDSFVRDIERADLERTPVRIELKREEGRMSFTFTPES